jgi:hypothetical protein
MGKRPSMDHCGRCSGNIDGWKKTHFRVNFRRGIITCKNFKKKVSVDIARTKCDKGFDKKDYKPLLCKEVCRACKKGNLKDFESKWERGIISCKLCSAVGINTFVKTNTDFQFCPYRMEHKVCL